MDVRTVKISGFRNVTDFTLHFGTITALVGLNGYGKSNAIDAIDFGFDFLRYPADRKEELMSAKGCIPLLKVNAGKNYSFEIEGKMDCSSGSYFVNYGYSFSWETNQSPSGIKTEFLRIKRNEKGQKYSLYIDRNGSDARYKTSESGRCDKRVKVDSNVLVVNKIAALDDLFYIDILQKLNSLRFFVERHMDASSSFIPAPFVVKGFSELELEGIQSIPRAIFYLKRDFPDKYELLIDAFRQLFPNIESLHVEEIKLERGSNPNVPDNIPLIFSDSIFVMNVNDSNFVQPLGFDRLSEGTKRVFLMLTFAIIADIKNLSVIAIEEPENSIHPGLFQHYLDVVTQLVDNCRIIISSHSPYIIQYLNPQDVYIGLARETGETDFKRIAPTKVRRLLNDSAEYNRSVGDYIFDLLSSADANEYLQEYIEQDGKKNNSPVC